MRRFISYSFLCVGLLMIAISSTLIIAKSLPLPSTIEQLHLIDCDAPCLAGIRINQTNVGTARQQIAQLFGKLGYVQRPVTVGGNTNFLVWDKKSDVAGPSATLSVIFDKGVATSVGIGTNSQEDGSMPNLGDILNALGPPDCLYVYSKSAETVLVYENYLKDSRMVIVMSSLTLTQSISSMSVTAQNRMTCTTEFMLPWRGLFNRTLYHAGH